MITNSQKIEGALLSLLLLFPAFLVGGRGEKGIALFSVTLFILFILYRKGLALPVSRFVLFSAMFFGLWITLHSFFIAPDRFTAIYSAIPLICGILFFLVFDWKKHWKIIEIAIIFAATILATIGLVRYLYGAIGVIRLGSLFFQHNVFAGFLILPILLTIDVWFRDLRKGRLYTALSLLLMIAAFLLTFSRGGYISLAISLLLYFGHRFLSRSLPLKRGILLLLICFSAAAVAWGIYELKTVQAKQHDIEATTPFAGERSEAGETGFRARLEYWKLAGTLIKERPLLGHGLGGFADGARRVQEDVRFYSTDPHNLYLRMFVELGLIGALAFLLFIALVGFAAIKQIYFQPRQFSSVALFAGWIGLLVHNGGDVDFEFPANIYLFFAASGALISLRTGKNKIVIFSCIFFSGLIVIIAATFFIGRSYANAAFLALGSGNWDKFKHDSNIALFLRREDVRLSGFVAKEYFARGDIESAKEIEDLALHKYPTRNLLIERAYIAEHDKDYNKAEELLTSAIAMAPYRDLAPNVTLFVMYRDARKFELAREIAHEAERKFPDVVFSASIWATPERDLVRKQRDFLSQELANLLQ